MKTSDVSKDIRRMKSNLLDKKSKKGLHENFGDKEIRQLKDKYSDFQYGSTEERAAWNSIMQFDNWCGNLTN